MEGKREGSSKKRKERKESGKGKWEGRKKREKRGRGTEEGG